MTVPYPASQSDMPDQLALHLWPFGLELVPQHGEYRICHDDGKPEAPDQGDGIEEVGIARSCIDPEVVEGRTQQGGIEERRDGEEGISHHWEGTFSGDEHRSQDDFNGSGQLTWEDVPVERQQTQIQSAVRYARVWLEYGEEAC